MREYLQRMPRAAEILRVRVPDSVPEEPEYIWGKRVAVEGKSGIDAQVIIADWEDEEAVENFYAHFPDPEYPRLIPADFSPAPGKPAGLYDISQTQKGTRYHDGTGYFGGSFFRRTA